MPLQIVRQDITKMRVDAIVNTTNEEMVGYSGVDCAVHSAAGPKMDAECKKIAPLGLGEAKITPGYALPCKYVIHTSGPIWQGGLSGESIILRSCYLEALKLAVKHGCSSVAFPLISSGTYGYPKDKVLKFAVQVITEFLFEHELTVYICVFDRTSYEFSRVLFDDIKEFIDDGTDEECEVCCLPEAAGRPSKRFSPKRSMSVSAKPSLYKEPSDSTVGESLEEYLRSMDKSFAYKLFDFIDAKGMTDVECYKKANVDKKTFSKIKCNPDTYRPSKQTAVAFAIALKLNLDETQDLLASAGLTLSRSFTFDKIIRYFIQKEIYDIFEINEALFEFDQVLLGC
ncbi:MAG: RNase III inhibitor [Ruminococcaceae bacterium]|nr:RNase III inhibitor [Oscillospiraceae bacterium]